MKNEMVAKIIAKAVYAPSKNDFDMALQVLIEKLCIPSDVKSYTEQDVERNILWHLNTYDELQKDLNEMEI